MKKMQKTIILLAVFILVNVAALYYVSFQVTPRTLGPTFPLDKKWSTCVKGSIQTVSAEEGGKIFARTSTTLMAYDQVTGSLVWETRIALPTSSQDFPPRVIDGKVLISDGEYLWALALESGNALWKNYWKTPFDGGDAWLPDVSNKFVLLNPISDRIMVYDIKTGHVLWEAPGGRGYTQAFIDNDKVYVVNNGVQAYDAFTGELLWEINSNRATALSTFKSDILYYAEYPGNRTIDLVAYNTEMNVELWRKNFPANNPPDTAPRGLYTYNNSLYLTQYSYIYRIDPENGKTLWTIEFDNPKDMSFIGNNIYILKPAYRIINALDMESGNELSALQISLIPFPLPYFDAQIMASTDSNLVFNRGCEIFVYGK